MLAFCEDCGERNDIDPVKVKADNNRYRCQACNFLNILLTKPKSKKEPQKTEASKKNAPLPKKAKISPANTPASAKQRTKNRKKLNIHEEPFSRVFKNFAENRDILGAYIYHFTTGLIVYDVDSEMTEETMAQIGKALSVCCPFGRRILTKTKETYLVLENQTAICRHITTNSLLIILCPNFPEDTKIIEILGKAVNQLQVFI